MFWRGCAHDLAGVFWVASGCTVGVLMTRYCVCSRVSIGQENIVNDLMKKNEDLTSSLEQERKKVATFTSRNTELQTQNSFLDKKRIEVDKECSKLREQNTNLKKEKDEKEKRANSNEQKMMQYITMSEKHKVDIAKKEMDFKEVLPLVCWFSCTVGPFCCWGILQWSFLAVYHGPHDV